MAFYITSDGRAVSFEAEVKPDGTVRPKKYSEFLEEDSNLPKVHTSKTTAKKGLQANGDNPRKRVSTIYTKKEKERYVEPEPYFAPLVALKMQVEENKRKRQIQKQEAEIKRALEKSKNPSESTNRNHRTKTEKRAMLANIVSIIKDAKLPENAYNFVFTRISTLTPLTVNDKLKRKISGRGLGDYKDKIIEVINSVNYYLRYDSHCKARTNSKINANKEIRIKKTVEIEEKYVDSNDTANGRKLKGNEWISGNYIMKGKQPKYGYARNYFGRVQERDSYREDRLVNPYSSISSYDVEDDNESLDIL